MSKWIVIQEWLSEYQIVQMKHKFHVLHKFCCFSLILFTLEQATSWLACELYIYNEKRLFQVTHRCRWLKKIGFFILQRKGFEWDEAFHEGEVDHVKFVQMEGLTMEMSVFLFTLSSFFFFFFFSLFGVSLDSWHSQQKKIQFSVK